MRDFESQKNPVASVDLTSLRLRQAQGQSVDVMQEFVSHSANPKFGAEHFLQTFSFALKESTDIDDFQWRCMTGMKPEHIQIVDELVWEPNESDRGSAMIRKYSARLAEQLGQFALRRPDEAANAAIAWSEGINTLIQSEAVSLSKMHLIRNKCRVRLDYMKKQGEGAGSADAVAAFIVLSNLVGLERNDNTSEV